MKRTGGEKNGRDSVEEAVVEGLLLLINFDEVDVNDNSPHFVGAQPIRLRLSVDNLDQLTANMVIGKVMVEDPDADDNGRLELRVAPDMNRLFTVSNDGVVAINGDFTAAHFGEHRLFIVARDHGDPPRESKAEVIVSIFGTLITMATELPTTSVASSSPRPLRLAPVFNPPQITVTADENEADIEIAKAAGLAVDPSMPHFVSITVHVGDVNDWIPNFESSNYNFVAQEDTMPGTIIGQVTAFDQDKEDPNNRIRYRLVSAGGLENYFAVNGDTGLITLALQVDAFAGEKITLWASLVVNTAKIPQLELRMTSFECEPQLTLGAFSVTAGNDGNCELRTQMELDRESVERYLLNITVTAGTETDFALVSVTVLDVNDNVPRFIYDNDLGLTTYFAGVSSTAGAFTRVLTVKAEDSDLGNSSVVNYALDPLSMHSKYFT
ncbi:cadherin domain protein, partial [Teladorsagia circumcincta]